MALILKEGKAYADPYGNEITTAVAVVDNFSQNRRRKRVKFTSAIYASQQASERGHQSLWSSEYVVSGTDYQNFVQGGNLYDSAEQYLLDLEEPDFVDPTQVNKPWGDWEKGTE